MSAPDAVEPDAAPDDVDQDALEDELFDLMSDIDEDQAGEDTASAGTEEQG